MNVQSYVNVIFKEHLSDGIHVALPQSKLLVMLICVLSVSDALPVSLKINSSMRLRMALPISTSPNIEE